MRLAAPIIFALALVAAPCAARDLPALYDWAMLEQSRPSYERTTLRILNDVILPALLDEHRQRLGQPQVDFPLFAAGELRGRPLAFYALAAPPRAVMPMHSLRFLDDLCTAYAWLQVNGYGLETVSEYTAMLRHHDFPGGRVPLPLTALQIPANALANQRVDELALSHFVTARTFLLLHEMGHLLHGKRATSSAHSRASEEDADRFAASAMKRAGLPPLGILVFFMADAHWAGFPSSERDTHPLSGARMRALARHVDDPELARGLATLGTLVDDPEIRSGFAATGKAGNVAALAPRRRGELPKLTPAAAGAMSAFEGRYAGESRQAGEPRAFAIQLALARRGEQVDGEYTFGLGVGTIRGTIVGNTLEFVWDWAGKKGRGRFVSRDGGSSFAGTWGFADSADDAGTWNGQRKP